MADSVARYCPSCGARVKGTAEVFSKPQKCPKCTDGFAAYPEAVDLAFGPYARYGVIIKQYRNTQMKYTPGGYGRHRADRATWDRERRRLDDMHVTRRKAEWSTTGVPTAAESAHALLLKEIGESRGRFRHVRCILQLLLETRQPGTSGKKRPTAAMMAGLEGHVWNFDELFQEVLN